MARAPLALLLAAAATAAGGVWEEVGRNTDVTVDAAVHSRWVQEGRAPDVGPVASLGAEARLSIPASTLNLVVLAGAERSLDGTPRLDRREAGIAIDRLAEGLYASLAVDFCDHLGDNPASPGRSFSEVAYDLHVGVPRSDDAPWQYGINVGWVPRREETRAEAQLSRRLWADGPLSLEFFLAVGSLRATDADGDGLGRVESWSYGQGCLMFNWTLSPGSMLDLQLSSQVATEAPGRAPGVVSLGWQRTF